MEEEGGKAVIRWAALTILMLLGACGGAVFEAGTPDETYRPIDPIVIEDGGLAQVQEEDGAISIVIILPQPDGAVVLEPFDAAVDHAAWAADAETPTSCGQTTPAGCCLNDISYAPQTTNGVCTILQTDCTQAHRQCAWSNINRDFECVDPGNVIDASVTICP